jgi:hypothetical protein
MAKKPKPEPTQTTEKGLTIPVPSREEFLRNLETAAPKPPAVERDGQDSGPRP